MHVLERQKQRRLAVRIFGIGIGAGGEQVLNAGRATFPRGIVQRRKAALVHVLRARLLDDLALPLIDLAVIVQVRALRRQELHHVGLALRGGPHERGLSAPGFLGVDVGSRGQQRLGRVNLAAARGGHQRSFAVGSFEIGIGAGLEQRFNDRRGADDRGFGEGRRAKLVRQFDIRAGFDQRADQFQIAVRRGVHDGGGCHRRRWRSRWRPLCSAGAWPRRGRRIRAASSSAYRRADQQPLDAPASRTRELAAQRTCACLRPPRDRRRRRRWTSPGSHCAGAA